MSTIAFKNGILAADTQVTSANDSLSGNVSKIIKCDGFMGGACGTLSEANKFLRWISSGADVRNFPKFEGAFVGILIGSNGDVYYVDKYGLSGLVGGPLFAIGSGEDAAKGALVVGATAAEAIQAAIAVDLYTGGSVDTLHL